MTFNQVYDHFMDVNWIRCPERLHVNWKRAGIKWDCHFPNNYWAEKDRIFRDRFGKQEWSFHKSFDLFTKQELGDNWDVPHIYVCFALNSSLFKFSAEIRGLKWREPDEWDNTVRLWPRSNREITEQSIMDTAWAFVDTILFRAGRFRDIQQATGYSKQKVKALYRKHITQPEVSQVSVHDVRRAIRRKYNIEFCDSLDPEVWLGKALKHRDNSRNTLWVMPEPDMSYIMRDFDGDIDDLERVFYEEYPQYKPNTILV